MSERPADMKADAVQTCLVLSDFTAVPFANALRTSPDAPSLSVCTAPGDQTQALLQDDVNPVWQTPSDHILVWTLPQKVSPSLAAALRGETFDLNAVRDETQRFAQNLIASAETRLPRSMLVFNWALPPGRRGLGLRETVPGQGLTDAVRRMNVWLSDALQASNRIHIIDFAHWVARAGDNAFNSKLWYTAKIPYSEIVFQVAAAEVKAALRAVAGQSRKLLVLDLDDTLWGGVVGDDGWPALRLGGHDPVGESFVAFQHELKALKRRGILLAIASRNTEQVALEAIDQHPAMVLRREDFAAWRINWGDKAQNIVDIAAELNLGIDSIVFIDDDPTQRSRLREALPQVFVPEWPESKLVYTEALQRLTCFDQVAASMEDTRRTAMYQEEKSRQTTLAEAASREAWLRSLRLRVKVDKLDAGNLKRTAQLLNKTNQMNLATRRLSEPELFDWAHSANNTVLVASVADVFGEYGLTGIVSFTTDRSCARIVDFVMSCRVMDRGVEETLLYCVAEAARRQGLDSVKATLIPTAKNVPCKLFFDERSGFEQVGTNDYAVSLRTVPDIPDHLTLECANFVWNQFEPLSSRTG